jgi:uncharacterized protein (TIGR02246 family)
MLARRLFVTALLSLTACTPEGPHGDGEIRAAIAQQAEAWNRHDVKAWMSLFSEDADFVNIMGTALLGRPEIEQRHAELFNGIFKRSRVTVTTRQVRSLGATSAVAETDFELKGYDRLPPGIEPTEADGTLRTRMKYVWQLRPEGWRVVSAQNTAVAPRPGKR